MQEVIYGWEQYKREEMIEKQISISGNNPKHSITFNGENLFLNIVSVPIELPVYRLENGRTSTEQEKYIAMHPEVPENFFSRDTNSPEAQMVQHELLLDLVRKTRLEETFKNSGIHQTEPVICTLEGVVINGNRRLSYWRSLYQNDKEKYYRYKYIDIAIFPYSDEDSILELEVELQVAPDIREPYIWHAEARMIKLWMDKFHKNSKEAAEKFHKDSPKDIEKILRMYAFADEFLVFYDMAKQWDKVSEQQQAFGDLADFLNGRNAFGENDTAIYKRLAFSFIKCAVDDNIIGSAHKRLIEIKQNYETIKAMLMDTYQDEISKEEMVVEDDDVLNLLIDEGDDLEKKSSSLYKTINDTCLDEELTNIILDKLDHIYILQKEQKRLNSVLSYVKDANGKLQSALAMISSNEGQIISKQGVDAQIKEVENCLLKLKEWIELDDNND